MVGATLHRMIEQSLRLDAKAIGEAKVNSMAIAASEQDDHITPIAKSPIPRDKNGPITKSSRDESSD
jgi:hypothetical protein